MSIKSKVLAATAALTLAGGLAATSALSAGAATPSCGSSCIDLFARDFGTHRTPGFVLDVWHRGARVGQPIILFKTSNSDPAEDFDVSFQGTVSDLARVGILPSPAVLLHYGCGFSVMVAQCSPTVDPTTGLRAPDDWAFEVEYSPYGVGSSLCVGVPSTPFAGQGVALEPCGVSARTFWVVDQADSSTGQLRPVLREYVPLINAAETNITHPFVLTYPQNGFPTDRPRPQLQMQNLTGFTNPGNGDPQGVNSNQLWGADIGVLR